MKVKQVLDEAVVKAIVDAGYEGTVDMWLDVMVALLFLLYFLPSSVCLVSASFPFNIVFLHVNFYLLLAYLPFQASQSSDK